MSIIQYTIECSPLYNYQQNSRRALRETKVYQEALQEDRQEGEQLLILRQVTRRVGILSPKTEAQVQALDLFRLEALGEALLDFSKPSDLDEWLRSRSVANGELKS